ncbi:glycine oxidase ThiO [Ktedonosporobacter rubrisoli]|uniref:glycine oxidase n=1 Tax=Ktedonosporobacter rubrisoli TaxID=2509675 RepID=A0A4P6JML9_KTERU|nr:glycine oxidase ThiO [Ktedonosporobacter rubrisoli]QBD76484.1 glycine oxidase ThiO [Ktedonosporobacter rubrisoli]
MAQTPDIVIIGGGVIGCSIAYHLRKAGAEVLVIEREEVAAEASSAAAGLLSPLGNINQPGPFADLLLASWRLYPELIPELEEASGIDVEYKQVGALHVATQEQTVEKLRHFKQLWEEHGARVNWLSGDEVREMEPLLSPHALAALHTPEEGSMKVERLTRAFAGAARQLGVRFQEHTEVKGFQRDGARVTGIQTVAGETIACNQLVIASGAWSARCGEWLDVAIPVEPVRGQILSLRQMQTPLRHAIFSEEVYMAPKLDGTIYVGATVERVGYDKRNTVGGVAWVLNSAMHIVPEFEKAGIVNIWAGLRPGTPDGVPILGRAPGWDNVILATGHNGQGFELCAITGRTIAGLVLSGQTPALIRAFGLERFGQGQQPLSSQDLPRR